MQTVRPDNSPRAAPQIGRRSRRRAQGRGHAGHGLCDRGLGQAVLGDHNFLLDCCRWRCLGQFLRTTRERGQSGARAVPEGPEGGLLAGAPLHGGADGLLGVQHGLIGGVRRALALPSLQLGEPQRRGTGPLLLPRPLHPRLSLRHRPGALPEAHGRALGQGVELRHVLLELLQQLLHGPSVEVSPRRRLQLGGRAEGLRERVLDRHVAEQRLDGIQMRLHVAIPTCQHRLVVILDRSLYVDLQLLSAHPLAVCLLSD
mmetsp:Transcript_134149/g.428676  ORF Transcript_134149/g.428676 Transcript_134149/m.428676 type:complete len:258 (+) Transcript_134149:139-912(+)